VAPTSEPELYAALAAAIEDELEGALEVRRRLREHPEPAWQEVETSATIVAALGGAQAVGKAGVVAAAGPEGEPIVVRAELDALEVDGRVTHACGHDAHMAALIALFRAARACEPLLPRRLLALFQASEEAYPSGAAAIVESGALGRGVGATIGAHVHPQLAWGEIGCDAGVVNASSDVLGVTMVGGAGHVAYPEQARNPIPALAAFVAGLAALAGDGRPAGSLATVSRLEAGTADNVIPSRARATVALRAMSAEARQALRDRVARAAREAASAHDCDVELELTEGEPPLANDPQLAARAGELLVGSGFGLAAPRRSFGSDDFAYFGSLGPQLMMFVGIQGAPGFRFAELHDPGFTAPDAAVRAVALALAAGYCAACFRADDGV
jgi:amidohydrolase